MRLDYSLEVANPRTNQLSRKVGVYLRISDDREGKGLGVARQLAEITSKLKAEGLKPIDVYSDNDISASRGTKKRKEYERLLNDILNDRIDTVYVFAVDRLYRQVQELLDLLKLLENKPSVEIHSILGGAINLATPEGRTMATVQVALASGEITKLKARIRSKHKELAIAGKSHGGQRIFGYQNGMKGINKKEANAVKKMAELFIATENSAQVVRWLDKNGFKTVQGKDWSVATLRRFLLSPSIVGIRAHNGDEYDAEWEPILEKSVQTKIRKIYNNPSRHTNASLKGDISPKYLLTGLVMCGKCGHRLHSSSRRKNETAHSYTCRRDAGLRMRGCGALRIQAPALEEFVAQTVLFRIQNNKKLIRDLGKPNNSNIDREYKQTNEALSEINHKKEMLLDMLMSGEIKKAEHDKQRAKLEISEKALTQNLFTIEASRPMLKVVNSANIEKAWDERTIAEKRNLIGLLIESVVVYPAIVKGRKSFDPDRVKITFI